MTPEDFMKKVNDFIMGRRRAGHGTQLRLEDALLTKVSGEGVVRRKPRGGREWQVRVCIVSSGEVNAIVRLQSGADAMTRLTR